LSIFKLQKAELNITSLVVVFIFLI